MHWLYKIVPPTRPVLYDPRIITWALFGNDEDGIFGERSRIWSTDHPKQTFKVFLMWWKRNPLYNLFAHVIDWQHENSFMLFEYNSILKKRWKFFSKRSSKLLWAEPTDENFGQVFVAVWPPSLIFRNGKIEGYALWYYNGKFGFAFRKANSAIA